MIKVVQKRFPADTSLKTNTTTFLSDKKIDGELYAYLQSISRPVEVEDRVETRVYFCEMPKQADIMSKLSIKSYKTFKSHLQYLIDKGYVIEGSEFYILDNKEDIFLMIPLSTLQFLLDVVQDNIIKIYIYLGQKYKYAMTLGTQYEFTLQELADHLGMKTNGNGRTYEILKNALSALHDFGLIDWVEFYDGRAPKKKLTKYSFEYKRKKQHFGKKSSHSFCYFWENTLKSLNNIMLNKVQMKFAFASLKQFHFHAAWAGVYLNFHFKIFEQGTKPVFIQKTGF